jgi:predicted RNase H-like nuclease (RuvC/YqgF family)
VSSNVQREGVSDETQSAAVDGTDVHRDAREVEQLHATIAKLQEENARLWRSYELLKEELALVKRRLFVAKAERVDTSKLQLEFEELLQAREARRRGDQHSCKQPGPASRRQARTQT